MTKTTSKFLTTALAVAVALSAGTAAVALPQAGGVGATGVQESGATSSSSSSTAAGAKHAVTKRTYVSTTGRFIVHCNPTVRASEDAILAPGMPGMSHRHDFFGPKSVTSGGTVADLMAADSSCSTDADRSAYWHPTLSVGGVEVEPARIQAYYNINDLTRPSPRGLSYVTAPNSSRARWLCAGAGVDRPSSVAKSCRKGEYLMASIHFPGCWDGKRLDSPDHRTHMAFQRLDLTCPTTHPVAVPQLALFLQWSCNSVCGPTGRLSLSSGSTGTLHADVVAGWDTEGLRSIIARCRDHDCGVIGSLGDSPRSITKVS